MKKTRKKSIIVGLALIIIGLLCLFMKAISIEYVDETGLLHEKFYLIPLAFLFMFSGVIVILVTQIINLIKYKKNLK